MSEKEKNLLRDKSRRRFFRHACEASVKGHFEYDMQDKWNRDKHSGYFKTDVISQSGLRVLNISEGGAAIISQCPVPRGAIISLRIATAFKTTISSRARARWSKRLKGSSEAYAIGLEFHEMSRRDTRKLKDFLKVLETSATRN